MKKKSHDVWVFPHWFKKMWLKMRCIFLFLFLCCFSAVASSQKVTLKLQDASLATVLQQLKSQAGVRILYNTDLAEVIRCGDVHFEQVELERAIQQLLKGTSLGYEIIDGVVVIRENPQSQELKKVTGRVLDSEGEPLPGASVVIKGTTKGISTTARGEFEINGLAGEKVTLLISFIGMKTKEITVVMGSHTVVTLDQSISEIEDVVVTGYQTVARERATGAFSTVSEAQLRDKPQANLMDRLEGMAAGLMINSGGTTIRGITTIRGEGSPLIVVDGFISDNMGGASAIVADNIQNVTILKDAAAASIYGARSANGVIVVTTKSGQAGKTRVSGRVQYGFTSLPSRSGRDLLSNSDMIDLQLEMYREFGSQLVRRDGSWADAMDLTYKRDNGMITEAEYTAEIARMRTADNGKQFRDYLLAPQSERLYSVNISGGSDRNTFAISGEYVVDGNSGYERGVGSDRININLKDKIRVNKWVTATIGTIASYGSNDGYSIGALSEYAQGHSWHMLVDDDGETIGWNYGKTQEEKERLIALGLRNEKYNPLDNKRDNSSSSKSFRLRLNGAVNARIAEGIDFMLMYEQSNSSSKSKVLTGENSYTMNTMINNAAQIVSGEIVYNIPLGARISETRSASFAHTFRGQFNFSRTFDKHAISAIMGGERHKSVTESTRSLRYGYNDKTLNWVMIDAKKLANRITGTEAVRGEFTLSGYDTGNAFSETDDRFVSLYGNIGYTYDNRYILTGSLRWDDSNLFGAKYRAIPLWSVGAAWNINNESFMNAPFMDALRLRATYGINGNVPRGSSGSFLVVTAGMNNTLGTEYHRITNPPNDKLTWEKTTTVSVGIDMALFHNRLKMSWDYYNRETDNMLGNVMSDPTFGWSTVQRNYGRMRNHGTEISLNTLNIVQKGFEWSTAIVYSYNKNKLVESYVNNPSVSSYLSSSGGIEGYPLNPVFSFRYAGISDQGEPLVYDLEEEKVSYVNDYNALVYSGTIRPTYNGSFTNTFLYKGLNLSFMFIFNGGHVKRKEQVPYMSNNFGILTSNIHKDIANRWREPGDENKPGVVPAMRLTNNMYGSQVWGSRDVNVIKADYLCLRNITLSYDIPSNIFRYIGATGARAYMQVQNAGIWAADKDNLHPEGASGGSGVSALKRPASWLFGLNINL